jgi:uncharacterized protein (TIGR02145 family)
MESDKFHNGQAQTNLYLAIFVALKHCAMKTLLLVGTFIVFLSGQLHAQIGISTGSGEPDNSAVLDLQSTEKGLLIPRMSAAERNNIASPAPFLMIINTTTHCLEAYNAITSGWETIHCFECPVPDSPATGTHVPDATQIIWNWNTVAGAAGYKWNTVDDYSTATDMGSGTTKTETGLTCNTPYVRYVWAYNTCGNSGSTALAQATNIGPSPPLAGTHVPLQTQVEWNWNSVAGATGYKWNTINDYASATDMLSGIRKNETGLTCNTMYSRYVWAYNACGNSTPATLTQTTSACAGWDCGQPITDARDSKTYSTVQIGTQCWMGQNLNIGIRIADGTPQTNNGLIEKYCYNNLESNCDIYGGIYQWNEMMQYSMTPGVQGICPTGWHLPTDAELTTLTTYLGGLSVAGGKMKETGTTHWTSPNTGATNESGFAALPGGYRTYLGGFGSLGNRGSFWSSTFNDPPGYDCSWNIDLFYNTDDVNREGGAMPVNGFSVRCVKN